MIETLPFMALNAHSANFLHWPHHFCQDFCPTFRPIWIKFEIISPLDRKSWSSFKKIASVLFASCEPKAALPSFTSCLQDYEYLCESSLLIISMNDLLVSLGEFFTITCCSCLLWLDFWQHLFLFKLNSRQKDLLSLKLFLGFLLMIDLGILNLLKSRLFLY